MSKFGCMSFPLLTPKLHRESDCSATEKGCTWEDAFDESGNTLDGYKVSLNLQGVP